MVADLDAGIGRILDALETRGLAERTLVVFTSDNGGEWLSRNAPFFHRKDTVWEGGIRVPAIVRWPSALPAGRTLSQVGVTMDLSATFVALAGGDAAGARIRGHRSDADASRHRGAGRANALLAGGPGGGPGARGAQRRLEARYVDGSKQLLFEVSRDPGERDDLAAKPSRSRAAAQGR